MINPYITRSPVKDSAGFYGRDKIINRIFRDIGREQMQSHCVIGEMRIGKTSLLHQIMHREVQKKFIKDVEPFIFLKTDIPLFPDAPQTIFFDEWAKDISKISQHSLPKESGYLSFRQFVEDVTGIGYKIVVLLDDFGATIANSNLDRGFFDFLRALTQNYNISFILFFRTPLQYFLKEEKFKNTFSSPFFNALNITYLRFLEESEARSLIIKPAQEKEIDMTDSIDFILEQVHYHPFLLQLLSSIVFNQKRSSDTNHERILREFKNQTEEFFTYLWQHSDSDEQEALKKLSSKEKNISRTALDNLDRRSILIEDRSKIFCPLFEEFIRTRTLEKKEKSED